MARASERYSANPGASVFRSSFIVPDATGCKSPHRARAASSGANREMCTSFEADFSCRRDVRPVASGTILWGKMAVFPGFAESRSPWAIVDAASRLCAGTRRARMGRTLGLFTTTKMHAATRAISRYSGNPTPPVALRAKPARCLCGKKNRGIRPMVVYSPETARSRVVLFS